MDNLLVNAILTDNHRVNAALDAADEDYRTYGPEPDAPKNYQTDSGYKAVVQDHSSYDLIFLFKDGVIDDIQEMPF